MENSEPSKAANGQTQNALSEQSKKLKRLLEKPWFPEMLQTRTAYDRTQDDCDGNPLKGHLSIVIDEQGDAWMEAMDIETHSRVGMRFRTYMGGGMSLRTRQAILFLAEAIRLDNEECPQRVLCGNVTESDDGSVNPKSVSIFNQGRAQ